MIYGMSKLWNVKEWSVIISGMRSPGSILFHSQDMLSFRTHVFGEMIVPNGEKESVEKTKKFTEFEEATGIIRRFVQQFKNSKEITGHHKYSTVSHICYTRK